MAKFTKPPSTNTEHVNRLINRGMVIHDPSHAEETLSHIGYYRLGAYWIPYYVDDNSAKNHKFINGTSFDEVCKHYEFDRRLRLLLNDAIERIEVSIKTQWSSVLKTKYGSHAHLNPQAFEVHTSKNDDVIWSQSQGIQKLVHDFNNSKETYATHFRNNYDERTPPIWAILDLMSFGSFSKWLRNTKSRKIRNDIANVYSLDDKVLTSFVHHLVIVRNHCAHHSRLWNRQFPFQWPMPRNNSYLTSCLSTLPESKKKIYNTLTMINHFMKIIHPDSEWDSKVLNLIVEFQIDKKSMGFPDDFSNSSLWQ